MIRGRTSWQIVREGGRIVTVAGKAWVIWKYRSLYLAKPLLSKGGAKYSDSYLRGLLKTLWKEGCSNAE